VRAADIAGDLRTEPAVDVAKLVEALGSLPVVAVLTLVSAGVLLIKRHATEAAVLVLGLLGVIAAVAIADSVTTDVTIDQPQGTGAIIEIGERDFPSAVAAYATAYLAIAVALARGVPALAGRFVVILVAAIVVTAVAAARVYLARAVLSDAVAGLALGIAIFALGGICALAVEHVRHNRRRAA
jgi:membrane-associated phospholipid phosphatase